MAPAPVLEDLFAHQRGRCCHDRLPFADLVQVLPDAITRYHGSGRQAITHALERHALPTQQRAVYGKLARLPLPLAEAFLSGLTARWRPLFPAGLSRTVLPACLDALTVVVLDGKKITKAAKRLLVTRGRPGKLFGAKSWRPTCRPHQPKAKQSGAHTSVHKVLQAGKTKNNRSRKDRGSS